MSERILNINGEDILVSYYVENGIVKIFSVKDINDNTKWLENKIGDFIHDGSKGYILIRHNVIENQIKEVA